MEQPVHRQGGDSAKPAIPNLCTDISAGHEHTHQWQFQTATGWTGRQELQLAGDDESHDLGFDPDHLVLSRSQPGAAHHQPIVHRSPGEEFPSPILPRNTAALAKAQNIVINAEMALCDTPWLKPL